MEAILFPPDAMFLQKLCWHRPGIKPLVRWSCTVNTSTGGALPRAHDGHAPLSERGRSVDEAHWN